MTSSDNIPEFDVLPEDHHNAMVHDCLNYPNHWDYKDTLYKNYHFDRWIVDNPEINGLRFINLNIREDLDNFTREPDSVGYTNDIELAQNTLWLTEMEVRKFNFSGYQQQVTKDKHPNLDKIVDWFDFEQVDTAKIIQQMPSQWEIWQTPDDKFCIQIQLEDWEFGQMQMLGTKVFIQWHAGDVVVKSQMPFCSGNSSRHIQYSLEITGTPSNATLEKIKQGGEIYVK